MVNSGILTQRACGRLRRVQDVSFAFRRYDLERAVRHKVKGIRLMLTRAILPGCASAVILAALGIAGCNREVQTHPPLDKRIENVENELRRMEKTQQQRSQIIDHSVRTDNGEC